MAKAFCSMDGPVAVENSRSTRIAVGQSFDIQTAMRKCGLCCNSEGAKQRGKNKKGESLRHSLRMGEWCYGLISHDFGSCDRAPDDLLY